METKQWISKLTQQSQHNIPTGQWQQQISFDFHMSANLWELKTKICERVPFADVLCYYDLNNTIYMQVPSKVTFYKNKHNSKKHKKWRINTFLMHRQDFCNREWSFLSHSTLKTNGSVSVFLLILSWTVFNGRSTHNNDIKSRVAF